MPIYKEYSMGGEILARLKPKSKPEIAVAHKSGLLKPEVEPQGTNGNPAEYCIRILSDRKEWYGAKGWPHRAQSQSWF